MKQCNIQYSSSNWKLGTRISKYRLNGARSLEPGYICAITFQMMPIAPRQKRSIIRIDFQFTRLKEKSFTSPLKHFPRSFLSPRTNCGKTSSHFGSGQGFIVNCSKLSFQFSITSDLKQKGNDITTHAANSDKNNVSARALCRQ